MAEFHLCFFTQDQQASATGNKQDLAKTYTSPTDKGQGRYFTEEEEEGGRGCFEQVHWREAQVQGHDSHPLAELLRLGISCRRCDAHFFLLGPINDDSFLWRVLLGGL